MLLHYEIDELKDKIIPFKPFPMELNEYFRAKLTFSSIVLGGNCLTEAETKNILINGLSIKVKPSEHITINGKPLKNHLEVLGHNDAFNYMCDHLSKTKTFTIKQILKLHKIFFYRIEKKKAGSYRKDRLIIPGSKYKLPKPDEIPPLLEQYVKRIEFFRINLHPVEFAAKVNREFLLICPFADGNGVIARLLMNISLLQTGYFISIIPSNMKNKYISVLERSRIDERIFTNFIGTQTRETYSNLLRYLTRMARS